MSKDQIVNTRRELVLLVDFKNCNPQGDPDDENAPRTDSETGRGLITSASIKRKLRDTFVLGGYQVYVSRGGCLQRTNRDLAASVGAESLLEAPSAEDDSDEAPVEDAAAKPAGRKKATKPEKPLDREKAETDVYAAMCKTFIDVRLFGGFIPKFRGRCRGPIQISMGESIDPVTVDRMCITRVAIATEAEEQAQGSMNRGMGRQARISYGLYRFHIYVSPSDAMRTGVTEADYELFVQTLKNLFDNDRSSVRNGTVRGLYEFRHKSQPTGMRGIRGDRLLESIRVVRKDPDKPLTCFDDYAVMVPTEAKTSSDWEFRDHFKDVKWTYE